MAHAEIPNQRPLSLSEAIADFEQKNPDKDLADLGKTNKWGTGHFVTYNPTKGFAIQELNTLQRMNNSEVIGSKALSVNITKFEKELLATAQEAVHTENKGYEKVVMKMIGILDKAIDKDRPNQAEVTKVKLQLEEIFDKVGNLYARLNTKQNELQKALKDVKAYQPPLREGEPQNQEQSVAYANACQAMQTAEDEILLIHREIKTFESGSRLEDVKINYTNKELNEFIQKVPDEVNQPEIAGYKAEIVRRKKIGADLSVEERLKEVFGLTDMNAKAPGSLISTTIEKLQQLIDNPSLLPANEINSWITKSPLFTANSLRNIPQDQILHLTSLLYKIRPQLTAKAFQQSTQCLPEDAKKYLQILTNFDPNPNKVNNMIFQIKNLFKKDAKSLLPALAHFINITNYPLLWLDLPKNELLQLAPYLRTMDLSGYYDKKDPNFEIELIEKCPNLRYLKINNPKIKKLPTLPNCQKLDCRGCSSLTTLPALPLCETLDCRACSSLTTLHALPLCKMLYCSNCRSLTALPALPLCQTLFCRNSQLRTLPAALPNCQTLDCSNCTQLTVLPALPHCQALYCRDCTSLTALPVLPNCQTLNCNNCSHLQTLPAALPRCEYLDCTDCPLLTTVPELPFTAQLAGNNVNFSKFQVDLSELANDPKKFLLELGEKYLLKGRSFPNIYYFSNGKLSPAVDVGGVRRDFISRLFELIFKEGVSQSTSNNSIGILPSAKDKDAGILPHSEESPEMEAGYRTIGRLFALCYAGSTDFKTGELFDPRLFEMLKAHKTGSDAEEIAMQNYLILKGLPISIGRLASKEPPDMSKFDQATLQNVAYLLDEAKIPDFSKPEVRANLRNEILKEANTNPYYHKALRAVSYIASEMEKSVGKQVWETLRQEKTGTLQTKIQGELNKGLLKAKLSWPLRAGVTAPQMNRIKGFLENWIDRMDKDQLRQFVRAVTSNNSLGARELIVEVYNRDANLIPAVHTCFFTLELTANCESQKVFDEKLELLLTEGMAGDGFQFA